MRIKKKAFTLAELLVVVAILSMIAAFGIPNYTRAQQRADEREAVSILRVIGQGLELYKTRNNTYPPAMANTQAINSTLNLGIIAQNVTYACSNNAGVVLCTATSPSGWVISYSTATKGTLEVYCSTTPCPTCAAANCSYIGRY